MPSLSALYYKHQYVGTILSSSYFVSISSKKNSLLVFIINSLGLRVVHFGV